MLLVTGAWKFVWLNRLKNSNRNCICILSRTGMFFNSETSTFTNPGPVKVITPEISKSGSVRRNRSHDEAGLVKIQRLRETLVVCLVGVAAGYAIRVIYLVLDHVQRVPSRKQRKRCTTASAYDSSKLPTARNPLECAGPWRRGTHRTS